MSRRSFVVAAVSFTALLVGSCFYVQTSAGFASVVLPLANAFVPGKLEVESGRLALSGSLEAQGIQYAAPELGIALSAREFAGELSLQSLSGALPHLHRLRLHDAELTLVQSQPAEAEEEEGEEESWELEIPALPISVGEAELHNLMLRVTTREGVNLAIGPLELTISQLFAGETGQVVLSAPAKLRQAEEGVDYTGNLELEAEISQSAEGVPEQLKASVRASVDEGSPQGAIAFVLDLSGAQAEDDLLSASFDLRAELGGKPLGEASGTLATLREGDGTEQVSAKLALRSLTESFLNPLIAPLGRGVVSRARIGGDLELVMGWPPDFSQVPQRAHGQLHVEQLDYRSLAISKARASLEANSNALLLQLEPARINRGSLSGKLAFDAGGELEEIDAALEAKSLDLGALSKAFEEEIPNPVEGVLDLSLALASLAPPGADLREAAKGRVVTKVRGGRIEGFNLMSFLAQQSGVEAFRAIPLDDFSVDADMPVAGGVARLHEAEVRSVAVELVINGSVALMGSLDLTIEAFIGPSVAATLERLGLKLPALGAVEHMVGVPAAVRVSGPVDDLSYGPTTPRTTERLGKATDAGSQTLKDAADKSGEALKGAGDQLKKWLR